MKMLTQLAGMSMQMFLDLHRYQEVQGAVLVLQKLLRGLQARRCVAKLRAHGAASTLQVTMSKKCAIFLCQMQIWHSEMANTDGLPETQPKSSP